MRRHLILVVMPQIDSYHDYEFAIDALLSGDELRLEELSALEDSFPRGCDGFIGRRWIINAIDCGALKSVQWILQHDVELQFRDEEGYTPVLSAIERVKGDRYEVLRLVLSAGADVNGKGINDYTPAHLAALRDDVEALRILVQFGADLSIRTNIDLYETPLGEAKHFDSKAAIEFLQSVA